MAAHAAAVSQSGGRALLGARELLEVLKWPHGVTCVFIVRRCFVGGRLDVCTGVVADLTPL